MKRLLSILWKHKIILGLLAVLAITLFSPIVEAATQYFFPTGRSGVFLVAGVDAPANVKAQADFVCDGSFDDVQIQAAINALTPGRLVKQKIVLIGDFIPGDVIVGSSYMILDLSGAYLQLNNNTPKNIIEFVSQTNFEIRGGILDGNQDNQVDAGTDRNQDCIYIQNCSNFTLDGLETKNAWYTGIALNSITNAIINVTTHDNRDDGILITRGAGGTDYNRNLNIQINSYSNGKYGTVMTGAYTGVYLCNIAESTIEVTATNNGSVTAGGGDGVQIDAQFNSDFFNNQVHVVASGNYVNNIAFFGDDGKLIRNNNFIFEASDPVTANNILIDSSNAPVNDNNFTVTLGDSPLYGVYIHKACKNNTWQINAYGQDSGADIIGIDSADVMYNTFANGNFFPGAAPRAFQDVAGDYNYVVNNNFGTFTVTPVNLTGTHSRAYGNTGFLAHGEIRTAYGTITGGNINAIAMVWHNPHNEPIMVMKLVFQETVPGGTPGSVGVVGFANDAAGTGLSPSFFTGMDLNNPNVYDSWLASETGGQNVWFLCQGNASASNGWVVMKITTQNATNLSGFFYIEYIGY